eukprot:GHRQ01018323.1.p3 GENE.GHRQ01018323.1~~GHRQ01018323.1.p3  ORF type:complete len:120 (+),score=16.34 GHRQ01018323.1:617-976(+)
MLPHLPSMLPSGQPSTHQLANTAESVIVSPDGRAMMLNKFGGVFEAFETQDGRFELNRTAKAWLGPGRPLGAAFDAQGNMIICDALKVSEQMNKCRGECYALLSWVSCSSRTLSLLLCM